MTSPVTPTEPLSLEQRVTECWERHCDEDDYSLAAPEVIAMIRAEVARDIEAADMPWTWRTAFKAAARIARGGAS